MQGKARESAAATQTFDALSVERRVLVTASRTISIGNVATVSVGKHVERSPRILWLALFLMCAAVAYAASPWGGFEPPGGLIPAGAFAAAALLFLMLLLRPDDRRQYLIIATNDGVLSRFTGPDRRVLEEVRRLLTDKMNRGDEASTFNVNFLTGAIEGSGLSAGALPAQGPGGGRMVPAGGGAAAGNGGHGRPSAGEGAYGAAGAAFAPGAGAYPNGSAVADQQIDFARLIPVVVEMHRFYARQQGAEHLEKRLEELELLMRSGAATASQKSRIRELTRDLSQILHSYPQVVQVFNDIRGMTGP